MTVKILVITVVNDRGTDCCTSVAQNVIEFETALEANRAVDAINDAKNVEYATTTKAIRLF